jgi:hypothetical protein
MEKNFMNDGIVKSPAYGRGIMIWSAPSAALHCIPCPVKCLLPEAEKPRQGFPGFELTASENFLFNGVNHCGVPVSTPHSFGFARLASGAFYFAVQIRLFTSSS